MSAATLETLLKSGSVWVAQSASPTSHSTASSPRSEGRTPSMQPRPYNKDLVLSNIKHVFQEPILEKPILEAPVHKAARHNTTLLSVPAFSAPALSAPFGVSEIDRSLSNGGLAFGAVHDWFALDRKNDPCAFYTPYTILALLVGNGVRTIIKRDYKDTDVPFEKFIVWIGRSCWPTPFILQQTIAASSRSVSSKCVASKQNLLPNCLFIDPPDNQHLLWAVDTALSSAAVAIVVAQINKLPLAKSKRLALKARMHNTLGLIVKHPRELHTPTAAKSTWCIAPHPSPNLNPRWQINLLKQKGQQSNKREWIIEFDEEVLGLSNIDLGEVTEHRQAALQKEEVYMGG
ncbi:hypothetical protein OAO01_08085 [Oligoflexia bacterium]|nr:hypothetical protein [Oligoflexia bacterium]